MQLKLYSGWMRTLSFLIATVASIAVLLLPHLMTTSDNKTDHDQLMLVLLGIMICFIHGVGFKPDSRLYRILVHPCLGWLLVTIGFNAI